MKRFILLTAIAFISSSVFAHMNSFDTQMAEGDQIFAYVYQKANTVATDNTVAKDDVTSQLAAVTNEYKLESLTTKYKDALKDQAAVDAVDQTYDALNETADKTAEYQVNAQDHDYILKNAGAIKLRNALTLNTLKSQLTQGKIANWLADRKAARLAKTEDYADQVDNDNYKSKVTYEDCFGDSGEMARELGVGPSTLDNAALCRKAYLDFDQKLGEAQNKMLLAGFAAALK